MWPVSRLAKRVWAPAVELAGISPKPNLYTPAHTYVSRLIHQGFSIKQIQTWANHSSIRTTLDTYGHLMADEYRPERDVARTWHDSDDSGKGTGSSRRTKRASD